MSFCQPFPSPGKLKEAFAFYYVWRAQREFDAQDQMLFALAPSNDTRGADWGINRASEDTDWLIERDRSQTLLPSRLVKRFFDNRLYIEELIFKAGCKPPVRYNSLAWLGLTFEHILPYKKLVPKGGPECTLYTLCIHRGWRLVSSSRNPEKAAKRVETYLQALEFRTENYVASLKHNIYLPGLRGRMLKHVWLPKKDGIDAWLVAASWKIFARIITPRDRPTYSPGLAGQRHRMLTKIITAAGL